MLCSFQSMGSSPQGGRTRERRRDQPRSVRREGRPRAVAQPDAAATTPRTTTRRRRRLASRSFGRAHRSAPGPVQPAVRPRRRNNVSVSSNHAIKPRPFQPARVAGVTSDSGVAGKIQAFQDATVLNHRAAHHAHEVDDPGSKEPEGLDQVDQQDRGARPSSVHRDQQ